MTKCWLSNYGEVTCRSHLHKLDAMPVRICDDCAPTPRRIVRRGDDGGWKIAESSDHRLKRLNTEADASDKSRSAVRGLWIQLEDTAAKFSGQVLRPAAMPMPDELHSQA